MRSLRILAVVWAVLALAGWSIALVLLARDTPGQTAHQVFVRDTTPEWEDYSFRVDAQLDLDELDRQGYCLWEFMRAEGIEVTLENVFVVGDYTDVRGGACRLIGEDDGGTDSGR